MICDRPKCVNLNAEYRIFTELAGKSYICGDCLAEFYKWREKWPDSLTPEGVPILIVAFITSDRGSTIKVVDKTLIDEAIRKIIRPVEG